MSVLITGAAGQVGRALGAAAPGGVELLGLGRNELDITDAAAVQAAVERLAPEVILNCAAFTDVDRAESEADRAWAVNAAGAGNLALAARRVGARLIHLSTDLVFDGEKRVPYLPQDPARPVSVYGRSKLAGEEEILEIDPGAAVVLRVSRVYSRHGANFVKTVLQRMRDGAPIHVVDDQLGTFTWADRLAAALWEIARRPEISGVLHWCDRGVASWHELACGIRDVAVEMGLLPSTVRVTAIPTADYPRPARRPSYSALDAGATLGLLDTRQVTWQVGLRRVMEALGVDDAS